VLAAAVQDMYQRLLSKCRHMTRASKQALTIPFSTLPQCQAFPRIEYNFTLHVMGQTATTCWANRTIHTCLTGVPPACCTSDDPRTSVFFKGSNTSKLNRHMTAFMGAALSGRVQCLLPSACTHE
jgi:hypothetical protein